jgi:hypothetical protein
MLKWILVTLILGVALVLLLRESTHESFAGAGPAPAPGPARGSAATSATSSSELDRLRVRFHNQLAISNSGSTKEILIDNAAIDSIPEFPTKFNSALYDVGVSPDYQHYDRYVRGMDMNVGAIEFCQRIPNPVGTPAALRNSRRDDRGCGWYFLPDAADGTPRESVGGYGTPEGPDTSLSQPHLVAGGQWIWSVDEAIKQEYIKLCARAKSCEATPQACAFCTDRGHGIPFDRATGLPKYADVACATSSLIKFRNTCPTRVQVGDQTFNTDVCGENRLSVPCLLNLMEETGVSRQSRLYEYTASAPTRGSTPPEDFESLVNIVNVLGGIQLTVEQVKGYDVVTTIEEFRIILRKLVAAKNISRMEIVRKAAGTLVNPKTAAEAQFNFCDYYSFYGGNVRDSAGNLPSAEKMKPFAVQCLQRQFKLAGCQPSGDVYPRLGNLSDLYSGKSLVEVVAFFRNLYTRMNSSVLISDQRKAIRDCLGMNVQLDDTIPNTPPCDAKGIEYFIYKIVASNHIFVRRIVSEVGFLLNPHNGVERAREFIETLTAASTGATELMYVARFKVFGAQGALAQTFSVQSLPAGVTYEFRLNGAKIPASPTNFTLVQGIANLVEIVCTMPAPSVGSAPMFGTPIWSYITSNLKNAMLYQPADAPLIGFNFLKTNTLDDVNRVGRLNMEQGSTDNALTIIPGSGLTWRFQPLSGLKVAAYNPSQGSFYIANAAVAAIAFKVNMTKAGTVFRLRSPTIVETLSIENSGIRYSVETDTKRVTNTVSTSPTTMIGKASRQILIVYNKTPVTQTKVTIYVDGVKLGTEPTFVIARQEVYEIDFMDLTFNGSVDYFHVYDSSVAIDMLGTAGDEEAFVGGRREDFINIGDLLKRYNGAPASPPLQKPDNPVLTTTTGTGANQKGIYDVLMNEAPEGNLHMYSRDIEGGLRQPVDYTHKNLRGCFDSCVAAPACTGFTYKDQGNSCTRYTSLADANFAGRDTIGVTSMVFPSRDSKMDAMVPVVQTSSVSGGGPTGGQHVTLIHTGGRNILEIGVLYKMEPFVKPASNTDPGDQVRTVPLDNLQINTPLRPDVQYATAGDRIYYGCAYVKYGTTNPAPAVASVENRIRTQQPGESLYDRWMDKSGYEYGEVVAYNTWRPLVALTTTTLSGFPNFTTTVGYSVTYTNPTDDSSTGQGILYTDKTNLVITDDVLKSYCTSDTDQPDGLLSNGVMKVSGSDATKTWDVSDFRGTWRFVAYAKNSFGCRYSEILTITWPTPTVNTDITPATLADDLRPVYYGGQITQTYGKPLLEYGVLYAIGTTSDNAMKAWDGIAAPLPPGLTNLAGSASLPADGKYTVPVPDAGITIPGATSYRMVAYVVTKNGIGYGTIENIVASKIGWRVPKVSSDIVWADRYNGKIENLYGKTRTGYGILYAASSVADDVLRSWSGSGALPTGVYNLGTVQEPGSDGVFSVSVDANGVSIPGVTIYKMVAYVVSTAGIGYSSIVTLTPSGTCGSGYLICNKDIIRKYIEILNKYTAATVTPIVYTYPTNGNPFFTTILLNTVLGNIQGRIAGDITGIPNPGSLPTKTDAETSLSLMDKIIPRSTYTDNLYFVKLAYLLLVGHYRKKGILESFNTYMVPLRSSVEDIAALYNPYNDFLVTLVDGMTKFERLTTINDTAYNNIKDRTLYIWENIDTYVDEFILEANNMLKLMTDTYNYLVPHLTYIGPTAPERVVSAISVPPVLTVIIDNYRIPTYYECSSAVPKTVKGTIANTGGDDITISERGIIYSKDSNADLTLNADGTVKDDTVVKLIENNPTGTFINVDIPVGNYKDYSTYYFCAYARNSEGYYSYSLTKNQVLFTYGRCQIMF